MPITFPQKNSNGCIHHWITTAEQHCRKKKNTFTMDSQPANSAGTCTFSPLSKEQQKDLLQNNNLDFALQIIIDIKYRLPASPKAIQLKNVTLTTNCYIGLATMLCTVMQSWVHFTRRTAKLCCTKCGNPPSPKWNKHLKRAALNGSKLATKWKISTHNSCDALIGRKY